jgi:recombination protein RecA
VHTDCWMVPMSLASTITKINKKYGDGTIIKGEQLAEQKIIRVTTGSLSFDVALGGGWPLNQFHEVIGDESSGKTVVALKTIAANQALDPHYTAFWVAAEALPMDWAQKLGVDLKRFYVHDTNVQEEAFDAVLDVLDSRDVDCVVVDSLPALMPSMEDEQFMADFAVGAHARLTGKFFRKSGKVTKRSLIEEERPVLGLMINQWRSRIGVMHGDPRTTPGGLGKNYAFFTRTEVRRTDWLTHEDDTKLRIGQRIGARVFKNKSAPGQRTGEFDFYFAPGGPVDVGQYDSLTEIINVAIANEVVLRGGRYYNFNGERIAEGKESLVQTLRENADLRAQISAAVLGVAAPAPKKKAAVRKKSD